MVSYKGWKFINLGINNRWRVISPRSNFIFPIIIRGGINEIRERVDIWMEVIEDREYY